MNINTNLTLSDWGYKFPLLRNKATGWSRQYQNKMALAQTCAKQSHPSHPQAKQSRTCSHRFEKVRFIKLRFFGLRMVVQWLSNVRPPEAVGFSSYFRRNPKRGWATNQPGKLFCAAKW